MVGRSYLTECELRKMNGSLVEGTGGGSERMSRHYQPRELVKLLHFFCSLECSCESFDDDFNYLGLQGLAHRLAQVLEEKRNVIEVIGRLV